MLVPVDGEHIRFCDEQTEDSETCEGDAAKRDRNDERTHRTRSKLWLDLLPSAVAVSNSERRTLETTVRIWSATLSTVSPVDSGQRLHYRGGQIVDDAASKILVRRARATGGDEFVATTLANLYATLASKSVVSGVEPEDASWLGAWKRLGESLKRSERQSPKPSK